MLVRGCTCLWWVTPRLQAHWRGPLQEKRRPNPPAPPCREQHAPTMTSALTAPPVPSGERKRPSVHTRRASCRHVSSAALALSAHSSACVQV